MTSIILYGWEKDEDEVREQRFLLIGDSIVRENMSRKLQTLEYLQIAKIYQEGGCHGEALEWVDQGLKIFSRGNFMAMIEGTG